MVTITLGNVSVGCSNANALALAGNWHRKMFRNPRGLQRFYIFYLKDMGAGDTVVYGWGLDGTTWAAPNVDLAASTSTGEESLCVRFIEDPANLQTIVYMTAMIEATGEIRLRRGTIADAASVIAWNAEEQVWATSDRVSGQYAFGIDNNGYLWVGHIERMGVPLWYWFNIKASQNVLPAAPIAWTGETSVTASSGAVNWQFDVVPYDVSQAIFCGISGTSIYAIRMTHANPPTMSTINNTAHGMSSVTGNCAVLDADNIVHIFFGGIYSALRRYRHMTFNPVTRAWGAAYYTSQYLSGAAGMVRTGCVQLDTSRTPNYLYALYESGTGELYYKASPADAISWSAATAIEDHAEDVERVCGAYQDDPVNAGNVFGAFMTMTSFTVRTFILNFAPPAGVAYIDVKGPGWWKGVRGLKFFLDGETFVGQDTRRWDYVADDTGFLWDADGKLTVPADRAMTSQEEYAYAILTATVTSVDISDCRIGFYADANHYAWIDQDHLRVRNGDTAERTKQIFWGDAEDYKVILAWTPFYVWLKIINLTSGRIVAYLKMDNPPQLSANVTFQVVAAGTVLDVEDYALFDAEDDVMYAFGFTELERTIVRNIYV